MDILPDFSAQISFIQWSLHTNYSFQSNQDDLSGGAGVT